MFGEYGLGSTVEAQRVSCASLKVPKEGELKLMYLEGPLCFSINAPISLRV